MNWTDFLAKVKLLKKDYETGQIDLRAGSLLTLLFAGAFDTVLGRSNCTYLDYLALSDELLHALGSSAALPKAKKGSLIGIANIASELDLHLWRTQMNPTYTFDINALFEAFLLEKDFIKQPSHLEYEYRRRVKESRVEAFIFKNVNLVFDLERYRNYFMQKQSTALVGLMGIVQDYSVRLTKTGREMGTFKMFLGDQVSPIVYVWPKRGDEILSYAQTQYLKNGTTGLVLAKPGLWNNNKQFTLAGFAPTNLKKVKH